MLILFYAVIGPLLGAVVFWIFSFVPTGLLAMVRDSSLHLEAWLVLGRLLPVYMLNSYTLGFLPSIGAGISHVVVTKKLTSKTIRILAVTLTGVIVEAAFLLLASTQQPIVYLSEMGFYLAATAAIASAVIAWFVEDRRTRRKA
jgi:hypothetical protein